MWVFVPRAYPFFPMNRHIALFPGEKKTFELEWLYFGKDFSLFLLLGWTKTNL
jgi:hypothetical protein